MAAITVHVAADGTKTFKARVRVKGHPTHTKTFSTKTNAKQWASKLETQLREGAPLSASEAQKHTLADAIERYKKTVLPGKAPKTRRDQEPQLAWWAKNYGARSLAAMQPPVLVEARDKLATTTKQRGDKTRTLSPATVNRFLAALSHVFTTCVQEWHWLPQNPMDAVSLMTEPKGRTRWLGQYDTEDTKVEDRELSRLLKACRESESADLHAAVLLALTTGGRQQEVMALEWRDIDLAKATVTFRDTKNSDSRTVSIPAEVVEVVKARARRLDTPLVFPGPAKPIDPENPEPKRPPAKPIDLRSAWETALRRAGITDFRWHDLRHTAASFLVQEGATLAETAAVLGHRTLSMVQRYAHQSAEKTATASQKIGARVFSQ